MSADDRKEKGEKEAKRQPKVKCGTTPAFNFAETDNWPPVVVQKPVAGKKLLEGFSSPS